MHAAALHYFREVARIGSIRRAADTLNVAASALNRQILKLEAEIGTPLFDRLPSGMRLTTAGDLMLRHVTNTLLDFERTRAEIDDMKAARSGHVGIAAIDSLLVDFLPMAIDRFRSEYPAVTYTARAVLTNEIPQMVADGTVDLGFAFAGPLPPSVRCMAEIATPRGAIMLPDHPLASRLSITLEEAESYPTITHGPMPRDADHDPEFSDFKSSLRARVTTDSIQMIKVCLKLNMGISFFTRLGFLKEIESGELVWRPIDATGLRGLRLGLIVPANRPLSPPAEQLARRLIEELQRFAGGLRRSATGHCGWPLARALHACGLALPHS